MHRFVLRVRYGDTDQMGFAYYANYLRWFEIGRAELMRSLGKSYRDVEADGMLLAHGQTEHAFLDRAGKPVRAPESLAALLERAPRAEAAAAPG